MLSILLREERAHAVQDAMRLASKVVTSALTAVECSRALIHARRSGRIDDTMERKLLRTLKEVEAEWNVQALTAQVIARAREPLPADPIRTLDALHIATILQLQVSFSDLAVISLDRRMRECVSAAGVPVLPV
ncbi:MAG: type II toxin-antitoxin system VapC family toxin [Gemmatimonadaceae bacterium]|nr:type II toxin-antitoxin system VapC family toxin [Gemmatimonadaceae bacterium]